MNALKNNKIDVIIPAYKAHNTIIRTLSSILMQTIKDDLEVTIVNDCCPEGSYSKFIKQFNDLGLKVKEVKLEINGGPGVARQKGIEATNNEFFTCIDADDTFASTLSLEILRTGLIENDIYKCASGTFIQLGEDLKHMVSHSNDMVWMFGKLYRREFINQYKIHFNETRANEDTGFNKWVQMLCNNPNEQIRFINEAVYFWHNKVDSITRINDGQYALDQCFCGWTDNMIYAIDNVRKVRPFDGTVMQTICSVMINLYFYYIETLAKKPIFAKQNWEYVKKFYNKFYKKIEEDITEETLAQMFSIAAIEKYQSQSMFGFIPAFGIKEFFDKLQNETYNENDIYDIWEEMKSTEEGLQLIRNNEICGVCPTGYTEKR